MKSVMVRLQLAGRVAPFAQKSICLSPTEKKMVVGARDSLLQKKTDAMPMHQHLLQPMVYSDETL